MNSPIFPPLQPGAGVAPLPNFVQIEPVGQCNLNCRMCPVGLRKEDGTALIEFETFTHLLDGFPTAEELQLQGLGEPLMHPRFFDMVRYAVARGLRVSTNSNLTLLTPRRARECVHSGLHTLHASIDGATASTYEYIRRGANFSKVLRNLDRLVTARTLLGSDTPHLRIVAVAMRRNLDELPKLVALAYEHGVDTVFVQHLCHDYAESTLPAVYQPMREFIDRESLAGEDPARIEAAFAAARERAVRFGIDLRLPPLAAILGDTDTGRRRSCDWPMRGAYLSYRGDAMPCCMVSTPDRASLGNMARRDVAEVWNGLPYRAFRTALASPQPPEICRGCSIYKGSF